MSLRSSALKNQVWYSGRMIRKPRPIEFMLRGYPLSDTLAILGQWDALSDSEKRELGFMDEETTDVSPQLSSLTPSSTFH